MCRRSANGFLSGALPTAAIRAWGRNSPFMPTAIASTFSFAPTMMKLLSRDELGKMRVYDRETDAKNPVFRSLSDLEQQRFLMNAMQSAAKLKVPEVQEQLRRIAQSDPSLRVRTMAMEVLNGRPGSAGE